MAKQPKEEPLLDPQKPFPEQVIDWYTYLVMNTLFWWVPRGK